MDRTIALISDIHSNVEALTAVFREIDRRGVEEVYCLGDIVGYGPEPGPVIELVRTRCSRSLKGNHDEALFTGAEDFNPIARQALETNREMILPGLFRPSIRKIWWSYLQGLEESIEVGDFLFVHGSPREPIREYVMKSDVVFAPRKIEELFARLKRFGFGGHTHQPGVFVEGKGHFLPEELGGRYEFAAERAFVNIGSVGQPRDGDTRSCFLLLFPDHVEWVRVEYDIRSVQAKIRRTRGIDELCAERLAMGR